MSEKAPGYGLGLFIVAVFSGCRHSRGLGSPSICCSLKADRDPSGQMCRRFHCYLVSCPLLLFFIGLMIVSRWQFFFFSKRVWVVTSWQLLLSLLVYKSHTVGDVTPSVTCYAFLCFVVIFLALYFLWLVTSLAIKLNDCVSVRKQKMCPENQGSVWCLEIKMLVLMS